MSNCTGRKRLTEQLLRDWLEQDGRRQGSESAGLGDEGEDGPASADEPTRDNMQTLPTC